jgi:hypothetical protein
MWRLKAVWLFGIWVMCMVIGNQNYVTDGKLCRAAAITAKAERKSYDFFNTSTPATDRGWNSVGFRLGFN